MHADHASDGYSRLRARSADWRSDWWLKKQFAHRTYKPNVVVRGLAQAPQTRPDGMHQGGAKFGLFREAARGLLCVARHVALLALFSFIAQALHDSTVTWQRNLPPIEKGARIHAYVT